MVNYAKHVSKRNPKTPQLEQAKPNQVLNNAGGFTFKVDKWERAKRFLILGNEGGSYYSSERKLTKESAQSLIDCANEDLSRLVYLIQDISLRGRAPKQDPIIFAMALLSNHQQILRLIPDILRTSAHLFKFIQYVQEFRGWGVSLKRAVANWYESKDPAKLSYQITKYPQRNGVSHRDVLRLSHPYAVTDGHRQLYDFITTNYRNWSNIEDLGNTYKYQQTDLIGVVKSEKIVTKPELLPFLDIQGLVAVNKATSTKEVVQAIEKYNLVREHIPNQFLNERDVWGALLPNMPLTALVRTLNKMSAVGLTLPLSKSVHLICDKLSNEEILAKSRIHPAQLLLSWKTYKQGHGNKGGLHWQVNTKIVDALENAFYSSFKYVKPSNKRFLVGIDVSGSMSCEIFNMPISNAEAAAAIAMTIIRTEPEYYTFGFCNEFVDLGLSANLNLNAVLDITRKNNFGNTDCAVPMLYATTHKIPVDVFVVITDNETWYGGIHPHEALQRYRQEMGIHAKLAVIGTRANDFSIADKDDPCQMDFVGFDTLVPKLITEFAQDFNNSNISIEQE